ncbi:MAG: cation:proton antiporter [Bacteroidetes bacterium]|nr:cation:proton antiporter [Bacteroidota bacterium]
MPFFDLFLVVILAWGAGSLASKLGYPAVLGELAAGIVFGPPVLGLVGPSETLSMLGVLGVVMLMLFIGMQVDPEELLRSASSSLLPAAAGLVIPAGLGYVAVTMVGGGSSAEGLMVGVIIATTALATVSRVLLDLQMLQTPFGRRLLCVSLLEVVLVLVAFAIVAGLSTSEAGGSSTLALVLLKAGGFLIGATAVGWFALGPLGDLVRRFGLGGRPGAFTLTLVIGLLFSAVSDAAGLSFVPGAFLAGLFIGPKVLGGPFTETVHVVRDVGVGFLTPLFFFAAGFQADLSFIVKEPILLAAIVAAAFVGKMLAGVLGLLPSTASWREGVVLGFGMNGRGGIDVIMAGLALNSLHVIGEGLFTALILTTFLTTLPVPILLQKGVRWLKPGESRGF